MIAADEDALICDMAETYHVLNYRALPVRLLATLAAGLPADSRSKLRQADMRVSQDTLLLASAVDALYLLVWSKTKEAQKGRGKPNSLVQVLTGPTSGQSEYMTFRSGADFQAAWERAGGETDSSKN